MRVVVVEIIVRTKKAKIDQIVPWLKVGRKTKRKKSRYKWRNEMNVQKVISTRQQPEVARGLITHFQRTTTVQGKKGL